MSFTNMEDLFQLCHGRRTMRAAVVCPYGEDALDAIAEAHRLGIAVGILCGDSSRIRSSAAVLGVSLTDMRLVDTANDVEAVEAACRLVSEGKADLLMKGFVKTAVLLKGVLDKRWQLRGSSLLSHMMIVQPPQFPRPLGTTDGGMNLCPDLEAKAAIIENAVKCFHKLGVTCPKVAVLTAVEQVNPVMPCTIDAAALTLMNRRGQITGCIVDGPLSLDLALSSESSRIKGVASPVAGAADIVVTPTIEAGNLIGKAAMYMAGSYGAGAILGAARPIVLTSRYDTMKSKLLSIALGASLA